MLWGDYKSRMRRPTIARHDSAGKGNQPEPQVAQATAEENPMMNDI
jgi:hypothetical protein